MERDEYRRLYELEKSLWWFRGMEAISLALLERFLDRAVELDILDAGCGTGGMVGPLSHYGTVTALDRDSDALHFAQNRGARNPVQASIAQMPFPDRSFDLVTSFDVLYHLGVADDEKALREVARVLRPGGTFLVRVPAFESLRSRHDEAVHTRQRYGKKELLEKIRRSALETVFVSFANSLLFPVAYLRRKAEPLLGLLGSKREGSEVEAVSPVLNRVLQAPLRFEAWWLRLASLPVGLSLVAVAKKK